MDYNTASFKAGYRAMVHGFPYDVSGWNPHHYRDGWDYAYQQMYPNTDQMEG